MKPSEVCKTSEGRLSDISSSKQVEQGAGNRKDNQRP
jgi:hypothetical protein